MTDVTTTRPAETAGVPRRVLELAAQIKRVHGNVRIAKEKSGFHLYFASPEALEKHGTIELSKMHCALNAEMYLGLGTFARSFGTYNNDSCARCMKTGKSYRFSDLVSMPPLANRGIKVRDSNPRVTVNDTSMSLVQDAKGN